jgi:hypothetical protein
MASALMAQAGHIIAHSPSVQIIPPPPSVRPGALTSPDHFFAFYEGPGVTLSTPLHVDITTPGTYSNFNSLSPGVIPAGTEFNSTFIHSDHPGREVIIDGFVTFDAPILGVIVLTSSLNATDPILGHPGTLYPTGTDPERGYENDGDSVTLSADRRTLTLHVDVIGPSDQLRVLTAVPEPSTLALLGLGAFGLAASRWRRKRRLLQRARTT